MSFGFGIGDFLAVGNLAWAIYRSCKGSTEEFQEVCREALTVHTVIKQLQDEAIDPHSPLNARGASRKPELMLLIKSLEEALQELDKTVRKYQGLTRRERRIWNQLRLATEDLDSTRSKLTFHVTAINAFTASLTRGTLAQIETVLLEFVSEYRQGRRQPSLASLQEPNDDSVWRELESELAGDGISGTDIAKHKAAIKVFVQGLLSNSPADNVSLVEVASLMEISNDNADSESLSLGHSALDPSSRDPAELLTAANAQNGSLASMDGEEYESANEEYESADEEYEIADEEYGCADGNPSAKDVGFPSTTTRSNLFTRMPRTPPTFDTAWNYVIQIKVEFIHQPGKYDQFLEVLKGFETMALDLAGAIEWISALLVCHPQLVQNFNIFLPDGFKIECGTVDNHYAFRVIMPFAAYTRIPDLEAMQSLTVVGKNLHVGLLKWIDPASLNLLHPYSTICPHLDRVADQPATRTSGVIEPRIWLLGRLKEFPAQLKANKEAATHAGQSDKVNGTIHASDRPRLAISLRRALHLRN